MIDITKIHLATVKALNNHGIDYTKFDTIEELRAEIKIHRDKKHRETWKDAIRVYMGQKYRDNPEKYREQRNKNRTEAKEKDPEGFAEKNRVYRRTRYATLKAEKFKLLEIPEVVKAIPEPEIIRVYFKKGCDCGCCDRCVTSEYY
jgi:hypothetical protein